MSSPAEPANGPYNAYTDAYLCRVADASHEIEKLQEDIKEALAEKDRTKANVLVEQSHNSCAKAHKLYCESFKDKVILKDNSLKDHDGLFYLMLGKNLAPHMKAFVPDAVRDACNHSTVLNTKEICKLWKYSEKYKTAFKAKFSMELKPEIPIDRINDHPGELYIPLASRLQNILKHNREAISKSYPGKSETMDFNIVFQLVKLGNHAGDLGRRAQEFMQRLPDKGPKQVLYEGALANWRMRNMLGPVDEVSHACSAFELLYVITPDLLPAPSLARGVRKHLGPARVAAFMARYDGVAHY
ncbi:hypothetical protein T439DRAFT_382014 [Meredithblackwellia eburnea MCA 4105]